MSDWDFDVWENGNWCSCDAFDCAKLINVFYIFYITLTFHIYLIGCIQMDSFLVSSRRALVRLFGFLTKEDDPCAPSDAVSGSLGRSPPDGLCDPGFPSSVVTGSASFRSPVPSA